jgi:alanine racemase
MMRDKKRTISPADQFEPWVELDMENLGRNLEEIRKLAGSRPVMAEVGCNAHGHGLIEVAGELRKRGVKHFAVASAAEAAALRDHVVDGTVLNLGAYSPSEASILVEKEICQSVFSGEVKCLVREARRRNQPAKVHIEIDTGAGGIGIPADHAHRCIETLANIPEIIIDGIWTALIHQPEHQYSRAAVQLKTLNAIVDEARKKGISLGSRHVSGVPAQIDLPVSSIDLVRVGGALLGLKPFPPANLEPVYTLKTCVLMTKTIPAGSEIGWNNEKKIEKETVFAALPLGYYDGYPPDVLGKADVLIKGCRYRVNGFISADHITVDISGAGENDITIGDEVVLVGKQGNEEISHEELAGISGRGVLGQATYLYPAIPRLMKGPGNNWDVFSAPDFHHNQISRQPGNVPVDYFGPWIELDTGNLFHNVQVISKQVGGRPIMAVVKCNAYGHGIIEISKELEKIGIRHVAVVKVWEALALRENNFGGMILNLGSFSTLEAEELVKYDISQSVFSGMVKILAAEARKQNKRARIHIKVDTGLGRVGVPLSEAPGFIKKVAAMPEIEIEGIFTVLTGFERIPGQLKDFNALCDAVEKEGISPGYRHAAASGDVADGPADAYLDMVRPGNCLYGMSMFPNLDLRPVLSLKSRIVCIKKISAGATFGVQRKSVAERDLEVAVVPVGNCDGYPANVAGKADALVKGRRFPIIDIASHFIVIDITGSRGIEIGDEVVLLGKQGAGEITNAELSTLSRQSPYRTPVYLKPCIPRIKCS